MNVSRRGAPELKLHPAVPGEHRRSCPQRGVVSTVALHPEGAPAFLSVDVVAARYLLQRVSATRSLLQK